MASERRDPFRDVWIIRDAMERLINEGFVRLGGGTIASAAMGWFPLDVLDAGDHYQVRASLAGVRPADAEITIQGNLLTIHARLDGEDVPTPRSWVMHERRTGELQRIVSLPEAVDADRASASGEDGVLTLILPKAQAPQPRSIRIGTVGSADGVRDSSIATGITTTASVDAVADGEKDQVNEESDQSFPASDPPSWTPERT